MMRNWTPLGFAHAPEQDAGGSEEVPAPAVDELLVRILAVYVCARVCALHTYIPMSEYIHTQELERQLQQAGVEATIAHLRRRLPARTAAGRRQRAMTIACLDDAAVNQVLLCPSLSCRGSR